MPKNRQILHKLVKLDSRDPGLNLAVEELMLEAVEPDSVTLLVYVNAPVVVMGKNQNPWRECSAEVIAARAAPLFRRVSGGGTVYHDEGNLNFSFLMDRRLYDKAANLDLVRRALARLGVELERNDRGDLYLAGKKVSGNAMCYRKDAVLHHGTLLISADLDKLAEAIAASSLDIETHAVASVRAKVCNISDLHPEVDIDGVSAALAAELEESYEGRSATSAERLPAVDGRRLAELQERNTSWEWIFGRTPSFEAAFPVFSASGTGTVRIRVQKGTVRGIQTSDHALEAKLWDAFNAERFDPEAIRAFLDRKE